MPPEITVRRSTTSDCPGSPGSQVTPGEPWDFPRDLISFDWDSIGMCMDLMWFLLEIPIYIYNIYIWRFHWGIIYQWGSFNCHIWCGPLKNLEWIHPKIQPGVLGCISNEGEGINDLGGYGHFYVKWLVTDRGCFKVFTIKFTFDLLQSKPLAVQGAPYQPRVFTLRVVKPCWSISSTGMHIWGCS
jgi:hypothetical protein